ncbi:hypothetical protein BGZ97_012208 [Linnemannia gamsii]|uniref:DNA-directed RNA polymerase subunit n=1 Tax=Linnemannia gamsii TaxID=64522 RepID=A0A9P6R4B7_9FUNG|nr:hypothetical protein BGZ97_012208 [Linnemannia gamsii]
MLNQDNLAQHTQHHQELDESRDFVREFLETLDPSSAPQSDPGLEPVELTPDIVLRSPSVESKSRASYEPPQRLTIRPAQQQTSSQYQNQNQQYKQSRQQQQQPLQIHGQQQAPNNGLDKSKKKKKVSKEHMELPKRTHHESQPILQDNRKRPVSTTRRKEGNGVVGKDDTRQSKKRKQDVDDVEQGVHDLEIHDPHATNNTSSRVKRKRQMEGSSTKLKGATTTKGKQVKNRFVQDDRRASNQQDEDRRKDQGRRAPSHDLADNRSDTSHEHQHNRDHQRQHQHHLPLSAFRQNSDSMVKDNAGKKDSNKPRKILTQDSLIMNIPGKLNHLGIFKKGKASKKTTVQQGAGNEFSEDAFLNQRTDSRESRIGGRLHEQVVTSAYFTNASQNDHAAAASKSSPSYGSRGTHKQSKSASTVSSVHSRATKPAVQKRAVASTHRNRRHGRDHSDAMSVHSSANNDQQQLNRTNTYGTASTMTHVTTSEPLEDALDTLLETSGSQVQSPSQVNSVEFEQLTQPLPIEYLPTAEIYVDPYAGVHPYGYAPPPYVPWQLDPYYNMPNSHQQMYPMSDCPLPALPACLTVPEQHLQPIEHDIGNGDTDKQIQFGVLSPQEIVNVSEFEVTQRDLYTLVDRQPVKYGMLDLRLGTSDKMATCETCGLKQQDCIGHFAHIKLCLPVFHIGYFRAAIVILQNICKTCSRVLLSEKDRRTYLRRLRAPNLENLTRKSVVKAVNEKCKKVVHCQYCEATNGTVKKVGALRIVHEKFRAKKVAGEYEQFKQSFSNAIAAAPELKPHIDKAHEDMNPLRVLNLFKAISDEDCELLGMNPDIGRPEMYLWQNISVPPVCIRPSVQQDGASNEDDITVKLTEVIFTNAHMQAGLNEGIAIHNLMEQWDFLQLSVAMYINSELPGISNLQPGKPVRGFCQRLKGKQGRFRGNLSGKRVDFSGRTVISPDPNLRIDQVAVPELVAKNLTYPERVTDHNITRLRQAITNGTEVHPGANYVTLGTSNMKKSLKFGNRAQIASEIQVGDLVERHLNDGDVVLFNRQPSLHKLSIMAHYAKIRPWRTFRFNECVCNPYNADFDGDEMNLHVPQTEEARTEAIELMGVKNNLVTPRNGTPLIAAIQDFITASYLITQKDLFYDRAQFVQICSYMGDAEMKIDIPPPAIWKPAQRWTGKQIIGVLLKPTKKSNVLVNLECKTRSYDKVKRPVMDMCKNDGYLVIHNSEIMCGALDKSIVGDGNKSSLFYIVMRDYGSIAAAKCMNRLAKLCARWLGTVGFSIGINDVQPGEILASKKDELVRNAYAHCDDLIRRSLNGQLENQPGCDIEQTLEALISGELSQVRDKVGDICLTELNKYNSPLIMATCGSKGSKINVSQMVACVGQQIISGKRIPNGFQDRSLPHFLKNSVTPPAKGFVRNSFYTGLTPTEFLFHAVSGREGLVDTAVKTAETGYMQRRLMKALEDLTTHYDLSVRNSVGNIIQFTYGSDGLDPAVLEGNGTPVLFDRNFVSTLHILPVTAGDVRLLPWQIVEYVEKVVASPRWAKNCSKEFIDSLMMYVKVHISGKLKSIREAYEMMSGEHNPGEEYEGMDIDEDEPEEVKKIVNNKLSVTERQLERFLYICWDKFMKAKIEPASAVGAVGAQSIGEPGTQMTLKTFHFAGVASMNITLGVPRIKEIINAAKVITTPIITTRLVNNTDVKSARIVKGRIEKTMLGDIAEFIDEVYKPDECYIGVRLDMEAIRRLQLETDLDEVAKAIGLAPKLKIGTNNVQIHKPDSLRVYVQCKDQSKLYYAIKQLKRQLPDIIIKGLPQVNRAVINEIQGSGGKKELLVEGYGLRELMNTEGVVGTQTRSNHVMEVWKVLGIEAARRTILDEIKSVMDSHGLTIDPRHVMLLGDIMTSKGEVLGITRFGIAKMKDSVMMLASFEKTTDHLFEASLYSKKDAIEGVSECIIMGIPMSIGTGLFKLIKRDDAQDRIPMRRKLLFDP